MPESLDMALDDLVQGERGSKGRGRGGKGKGKSKKSLWGGAKASAGAKGGRGKGKKREKDDSAAASLSDDAKLDMSLEEVIEKTEKRKGSGKGKGNRNKDNWREDGEGKGKSRGSKGKGKRGRDDWDSWGGGGKSWSKGGDRWEDSWDRKGKGKGNRKGGSSWGDYGGKDRGKGNFDTPPQWSEHDDRADDLDDDWGGKGRGKFGKSRGRAVDDFGAGRVRSDRGDGDWQRVPQREERAPLRDSRRSPPRRAAGRVDRDRDARASKAEARGVKRRGEDLEDTRGTKSVKVTNIPRDVNMQDIKDAFESETGKIARCRLDRGTAWIAFQRPSDARKAIDTFDRGELNGQTIGVALDP